ncbi:cation-translocating P-type ATPase [Priestia megaterium]|nr:cation-translocating P-type ATPase [Priestia megaterium]
MEAFAFKERLYRVLPGRVRLELFGLQHNEATKEKFEQIFLTIEGVQSVTADVNTGKVLLIFNSEQVSLEELSLYITKFEEGIFKKMYGINKEDQLSSSHEQEADHCSEEAKDLQQEVAATLEAKEPYFSNHQVPERLQAISVSNKRLTSEEKVPISLALSLAGIGVLGGKQLVKGASALSRHPVPFYLSGLVAICSGYPFIRSGLKRLNKEKKFNVDLLLGVSSLALALIRENLVVLSGISLLQYLNWKRQKSVDEELLDQPYIAPEIEHYSRKMSRIGFAAAGTSFALTRNPLSALAVLLAANPRPALQPTEYTWKQANHIAKENNYKIPLNGSLYQLSQMKAVVFDDSSLLMENAALRPECLPLFEQLPSGTKVSFLNNKKDLDLNQLKETLADVGLDLCAITDEEFPKRREEVLFVTENISDKNNKIVSFYPSLQIKDLPDLADTYHQAKQLDKRVNRNVNITRIWNVVGSFLAAPLLVSAPIINLIADSLCLIFMSQAKKWTERKMVKPKPKSDHFQRNQQEQTSWHSIETSDLYSYYGTDRWKGLSIDQAASLHSKYGKNRIQGKPKPHWLKAYVGQFKELTTIILGSTAVISLLTGHLFDGLIMGTILLLNAGIGTAQERKAEQTVESLSEFVPPNCSVLRNGTLQELSAEDLVPGDIVELEAGDRVPADMRILESWNLEINEAALTGESLPVEKNASAIEKDSPLSDRTNMAYMGTHVTRGRAKLIVVNTGNYTEMGHLLTLLSNDKEEMTPLQKQVTSISKTFIKVALVAGGIVFAAGLLRGMPVSQILTTSIALTASAIPEGLPVTITIALTAGIMRMAKKNAVVRKLSALETLGRTTIICSDKTGTLTKNEMTVTKIATVEREYTVSGNGYSPDGKILNENGKESSCLDLEQLLKVGMLCNNTTLHEAEEGWGIKGDPTEGAVVALASKRQETIEGLKDWKRVHEIPFDSGRGMMSVVCKEKEHHKTCYVLTKGSIEKVLERCTHYQKNGKKLKLTKPMIQKIIMQTENLADQALRVIGFAYAPLDSQSDAPCYEDVEKELIYIGMVGMIDPPKEEVEQSINEAINLGIKPVMITGDHPKTALAIAKQIGICQDNDGLMTGKELDQLSDDELTKQINNIKVYARVTPEHKLRIVSLLQKNGHIVAMTGDGVNDSPAIKKANIGIAMGKTGTQVTKETSDMVLKKDHFGSIVDGVKEGRTIISNIRKALGCLLCGNLAEIMVTSTAVLAGLPLPIIPVQILLMNLLTDALPAMVLAVNPGSKKKITKRQGIVDKSLYQQVATRGIILGAGSLALFAGSLALGAPLAVAQTTAFATLVAGQLIQTFSWRQQDSDEKMNEWSKDRFLVGAMGISWLSLLACIYIPPFQSIFNTVAISPVRWMAVLAVAASSATLAKPVIKILQREQTAGIPALAA